MTHPAANAPAPSGFVPPTNSLYLWASYNANNQVTGTAVNGAAGGFTYDLAGNVIYDEANKYIYDFDGRICAVWNTTASTMTQYVYDAEGRRVAKGTISSWPSQGATCAAPTTANGFNLTNVYLRGLQGNQDTELNGQGGWVHTNIYGDGGLTATFWNSASGSTPALSYNFSNWLGTKRMQATAESSPNPMLEEYTRSYPYGNLLSLSGNGGDATEQHFTGKERDTESGTGISGTGNDYFGARYYASTMGRFLSPDPSGLTYADLTNPQSLNLYSYVRNNPLINTDPTGMECVWDDGSYDDQHDPDTGNDVDANGKDISGSGYSKCSAAGGSWVDHSFFAGLGMPDWLSADDAANSGGADQVAQYLKGLAQGCMDTIISAFNAQTGTSLTTGNVTDNFYWGGAVNIDISASNLSTAQYSAIQQTRYSPPGFLGAAFGIGPSLHLPKGPGNGSPSQDSPNTLPFTKQNGSISTSAHIDSA